MDTNIENAAMELIVHGGNARSRSMEAIKAAKNGDIKKAKSKIKEAKDELNKVHDMQTSLIHNEAAGNKMEVSLLMVHAQNHLMNAITIKDIAEQMIEMYEEFRK